MEYIVEPVQLVIVFILSRLSVTVSSYPVTWSCYEETGSCYYLPLIKRSYVQASCWCRSEGGHLVQINSPDELALVQDLIDAANRPDGFYVGATDMKEEGKFVWEDWTPAEHIPWTSTEPNNSGGNQHCVKLANKKWWENPVQYLPGYEAFDVVCDLVINFMCEKNSEFLPSRFWYEMSRDLIFPSAELLNVSGVSQLSCSDLCIRTCGCLSLGYNQDGGDCILYNAYHSRLTTPQSAVGYTTFD